MLNLLPEPAMWWWGQVVACALVVDFLLLPTLLLAFDRKSVETVERNRNLKAATIAAQPAAL